jgi:hypothetical protein
MNRLLLLAELALMVTLFFVIAGGPPPDVNEAHYLTKAKSYWQPEWCQRDLFLTSANAHITFFWLFGWITKCVSLPAAAWIGRIAGWLLISVSWMWLVSATEFGRPRGMALFTAAWTAALWEYGHLAGEWLIGGLEAKVPAYAMVFFALGCALRGKLPASILLFAVAIALHPLVGGWAALACVYAVWRSDATIAWRALLPFAIIGGVIGAAGIVPAWGLGQAPADVTAEANLIYVFQRLPHHLVFHKMPPFRIVRFLTMVVIWLACRRRIARSMRLSRETVFLQRFADASLFFVGGGMALDAIGLFAPPFAAGLLRFYWFRLADIAVPVAIAAISVEWGVTRYRQRKVSFATAFATAMIIVSVAVAARFMDHRRDPRPGADRQGQMLQPDQQQQAMQRFGDWVSMCDWVRQFTPADSLCLTPTHSQTFKWYADRAEVATWKDIPQDAQSVVQWSTLRERIAKTGVYDSELELNPSALQDLIADRNINYVVTFDKIGRIDGRVRLVHQNATFRVYRCGSRSTDPIQ